MVNTGCKLCPRSCGAEALSHHPGRCKVTRMPGIYRVARLMAHAWEEPFISGKHGSGTVFFSGCSLGCLFCQNGVISQQGKGKNLSQEQLIKAMLKLAGQGVHNLNLVTASHYADRLPQLLARLRDEPQFQIQPLPVIWNSSGYETPAALVKMADQVDVYLPDLKFFDSQLSAQLADAADYFTVASEAIMMMRRLQPILKFDDQGMIRQGLVIRHLILRGYYRDSMKIIDFLAAELPLDTPLSLLSQYTPPASPQQTARLKVHPQLLRRLTRFEYEKVCQYALDKGFSRLLGQDRSSAQAAYTPDFSDLWGRDRT